MPTTLAAAPRAPFSFRELLGAALDRLAVSAARSGAVEPFGL
ncbi:hypothetical protein [Hansschlegelia plantiphila]|nr:hypothetical protein [Hansschlegelia plantiphila]